MTAGDGSGRASRIGRRLARTAGAYLERRALAGLLAVSALAWGFVQVADEMREGETASIDRRLLLAFRDPADPSDPLGPPWFEETMRDVTALGGAGLLAFFVTAAAVYLWLLGRRGSVVLLLAAVAGGQAASTLFKLGFDRPRPDLVPHGAMVYTSSFPSGHAMMSAVVYLTLGAMLARAQTGRALKVYVICLAVFVTLAVGVSRVYLGVHWPSDVLAGWCAGAAWALLCLLVADVLQRRGMIDPAASAAAPSSGAG